MSSARRPLPLARGSHAQQATAPPLRRARSAAFAPPGCCARRSPVLLPRHALRAQFTTARAASAAAAAPPGGALTALDAVCFTLIVDDIVFPDGATAMGVLGGGGPLTCFGLRLHPSAPSVVRGQRFAADACRVVLRGD
jgi:hypothetical protein